MSETHDRISPAGVLLVMELLGHYGHQPESVAHRTSLSASEKADIVGPGLQVQKTLTLAVSGSVLMLTGVGDFRVNRPTLRKALRGLGRPASAKQVRHMHLNPPEVVPERDFRLRTGMVSPFVPPGINPPIDGLVIIKDAGTGCDVAVSLTLGGSLPIPAKILPVIVQRYAEAAYPEVPVVSVDYEGVEDVRDRERP